MAQPKINQTQLVTIDATTLGSELPIHFESYDLALFKPGKINTIGSQILRFHAPRDFQIPDAFTNSRASSRTVTAASSSFAIWHNDVTQIGTVTFALGTSTGVFANASGPGPFTYTAGDWLTVIALTADTNQEDISIAINGEVI